MDWDILKGLSCIIGGAIICFLLIACTVSQINFTIESVPLRVSVDGKEVYHGRSACVQTESIGSSSRVDVKTGPWCLFPKEYFAGKNIVIITEEKHG